MTELIPLLKVLHSVRVKDELQHIKCPLYREKRRDSLMLESMSKHRSYIRRILYLHTDYDEVQEWVLGLTALLYGRLDNASESLSQNKLIRLSTLPECHDSALKAYRETLLKWLT